jgi:AcrR family transcriptional regulator
MSLAAVPAPPQRGTGALLPPVPGFTEARRRVFEAAIVLFGERGFHAVSVRDIAAEVGLKPMALYSHVSSKQDLLFEIVRIGFETHRDALSAALLDAGADPLEQMRALCAAHVRIHLQYADLALVTNHETRQLEERFAPQLAQLRAESVRSFREVVERGQRLGVFVDQDPLLIVQVVGGMGSRAPEWWTPATGIGADEVVETLTGFAVSVLTGGRRT